KCGCLGCSTGHRPGQCRLRRIKVDRELRGDGSAIERKSLSSISADRAQWSGGSERRNGILHKDRGPSEVVTVIPRQYVVSPLVPTGGIEPLGEFFHGAMGRAMLQDFWVKMKQGHKCSSFNIM